jgi:HAD superfamily hydrolase (TIGR01549 family)
MKYLIWDFDGTLGYRQDGMWSLVLLEILRQEKPEFYITMEQIRPFLQAGFPWHNPNQPHTEIKSPEQWWNALDKLFEQAFLGIGINSKEVGFLAKQVRRVYPTLTAWRLFEDVLPTLNQLSAMGWTHLMLSNHVPELRQIIHFLELDKYISQIFNSAETGYEKPHRQAFLTLLAALDDVESIWMIGDSMESDILGANAVGLSGILVRKYHAKAKYYCDTLKQIPEIIEL